MDLQGHYLRQGRRPPPGAVTSSGQDAAPRWLARVRHPLSGAGCVYGVTKVTEVPQLDMPFLVPPHVAFLFTLNDAPVQFGNWMYSWAK